VPLLPDPPLSFQELKTKVDDGSATKQELEDYNSQRKEKDIHNCLRSLRERDDQTDYINFLAALNKAKSSQTREDWAEVYALVDNWEKTKRQVRRPYGQQQLS